MIYNCKIEDNQRVACLRIYAHNYGSFYRTYNYNKYHRCKLIQPWSLGGIEYDKKHKISPGVHVVTGEDKKLGMCEVICQRVGV